MAVEVIHVLPEGFKTYRTRVIGYVKGDKLYLNSPAPDVMVENQSQIAELAAQFPPGTRFFLAGDQQTWQLDSGGEAQKSAIPGMFYLDPETMNLYYTPEVE